VRHRSSRQGRSIRRCLMVGICWRDACLRVRRTGTGAGRPDRSPAAPNGHADLHASTPGRGACDRAPARRIRPLHAAWRHRSVAAGRSDRRSHELRTPSGCSRTTAAHRADDQHRLLGLDIPVGKVLASEYCRTKETAMLAFGRLTPEPKLTLGSEDRRRTAKS